MANALRAGVAPAADGDLRMVFTGSGCCAHDEVSSSNWIMANFKAILPKKQEENLN
jgi:hypothetical protein